MDVCEGAHLRSSPSPGLVPKFTGTRHKEAGRGTGQKTCSKVVRFVSLDTGQEVGLMSRWDLQSEVAQSYPTLCDPMDCSLPDSSIYGIFQARVLEWGAIAFSGGYQCLVPIFLYTLDQD